MRAIKSKDMEPELAVRRLVHGMGYRYRLHAKGLPGKPDMVFSSKRRVIFVHGCFWHQHPKSACKSSHLPKSNVSYWLPKLQRNVQRDAMNILLLKEMGWNVLVIWECEIPSRPKLIERIRAFLD